MDFDGLTELLDDLRAATGLSAAVTTCDGTLLAHSAGEQLCTMHLHSHPDSRQACLDSTHEAAHRLGGEEDSVVLTCPFGLTKCVSRIEVDGLHLANLMIGQFCATPPDPAAFEAIRVRYGFPRDAYAAAVAALPVVEECRIASVQRLLRTMAQEIARRGMAEARARAEKAWAEQALADRTRQVEAAESRLSRMAAQVPGALYQYRLWPDGRSTFPYASDGLQEIYGLTPNQVRDDALPVAAVIHADDVDRVMESVLHSARTLTIWHEQYRVTHPTKGTIWVEGRSQPERLPDGSVLWHGVIMDVTDRIRREETLRAIQDRYRRVARELRYGTWDLNLKAGVFDVDAGFFEMLGLPGEDGALSFDDWLALMHPEDAATLWDRVGPQLVGGDDLCLEVRYQTSAGGWIWVESRGRVVERRDGRALRLVGTNVDISDRKAVEQALRDSEARFRAFHENTPVAYVALESDGRIVEANGPFCALVGTDRAAVIGHELASFLAATEGNEGARQTAALLEGATHSGDLHLARADGSEVTVQVTGAVQRDADGRFVRCHCVLHDITDHARLEARLARSNADLTQFAYAVSHDLREPLRMVGGFLGLIERRLGTDIDPQMREWMAFARDGARRMNAMILDLLEYSRVGTTEIEAEPVPLASVATEALQNLGARVQERQAVVMVPDDLPVVTGDQSQLVRLFQNLVGNAVKFVPTARTPEVTIACADEGDRGWVLSVMDNGPGIPADKRDAVFGVFQRLDGFESQEGTGVGLALCKKIVERHGGTIAIDDNPDGGTVMRFTLPKRAAADSPKDETPSRQTAELVNTLNMHQMRIVARIRNLSHTIQKREASRQTILGEAAFLVQEVDAYRVFVHAHGAKVFGTDRIAGEESPLTEVDSLFFAVQQWTQDLDCTDLTAASTWLPMATLLRQMLEHVQRSHTRLVRRRSRRVARASGDGVGPFVWGA
ncbi:PAS domain-containing protein [uncultured Rhodospira sp.]|uniref:PAS domain-containing protein n=1 Tax=uncultured Rhodospira sp. TaxID=1936189 RepID=UPI002610C6F7|nr:PAS domain-containing protein [uncultured Rhodospira sp.]